MGAGVEDMSGGDIGDAHERVVCSHRGIIAVISTTGEAIELAAGDWIRIAASEGGWNGADGGRPGAKRLPLRGVEFHVDRLAIGDEGQNLASRQEQEPVLVGCE